MIKTFSVINDRGEILSLELASPEKSGFAVQNIDGLGPSKSVINLSQSLYLDGGYFNSARVSNRNIVLDLLFHDHETNNIETLRQKSYRFFPMKVPLTFLVETDNRIVKTTGYVESNEPKIFSKESGTIISLICPDAFFYGESVVLTTFSGENPAFEFPFENPSLTIKMIEMGIVFINTQANVFYTGDVETGVTVYVNFLGSANNIAVHNATTGESMVIDSAKLTALTGSNFVAGDLLIINTIRGKKALTLVRGGVSINVLNALSSSSKWFTLTRGDNVFTFTAQSGLSNMQLAIEHQIVYYGV